MRARIVPPYPSFTSVMSQIGDSSHEIHAGGGCALAKPTPRPYSKYDANPFMRTVRYDWDKSAHSGVPTPTRTGVRHSSLYPPRSKTPISLPLVGKFLQKHTFSLSQRRKCSGAI